MLGFKYFHIDRSKEATPNYDHSHPKWGQKKATTLSQRLLTMLSSSMSLADRVQSLAAVGSTAGFTGSKQRKEKSSIKRPETNYKPPKCFLWRHCVENTLHWESRAGVRGPALPLIKGMTLDQSLYDITEATICLALALYQTYMKYFTYVI